MERAVLADVRLPADPPGATAELPAADLPAGALLTPTQRHVLRELFAAGRRRPTFAPSLAAELRDTLETELAAAAATVSPDNPVRATKRTLDQIHTCEGWFVADQRQRFAWSADAARGTVAHKAVELSLTMSDVPPPLDLADLAIARLIDAGGDWGPRAWLLDAPQTELADLRGAASDWVVKFQDTFPPLRRTWRPRLESSLRVDLCAGRVSLRAKVDLALGTAHGTTARVLIVDFKTGRPNRVHVDDLRFYALLETLRVGVPPFRVATFSLDSGTWQAEDIDGDVLAATVRRVVVAVGQLVELRTGREATRRAGNACGWCPAALTCATGRAHRDQRDPVSDGGVRRGWTDGGGEEWAGNDE